MSPEERRSRICDRIVLDLLELQDQSHIAEAIGRRLNHLGGDEALITLGQVVGVLTLLVGEIKERSATGRQIVADVRNGLVLGVVATRITDREAGDGR